MSSCPITLSSGSLGIIMSLVVVISPKNSFFMFTYIKIPPGINYKQSKP
jgi:hypothetical protein